MFLCHLNINRYLIFCVSLLFFLRLSLRHLRGSCHVPPPEGAGLFDKEPNGMPRIHGHPRPKRTGPCEGRGDIVRAQLAPARCLVADAPSGRPGASKPGSKLRSHTNWPQAGCAAGRILIACYTLTPNSRKVTCNKQAKFNRHRTKIRVN